MSKKPNLSLVCSKVYLVILTGTDYSMRDRPDTYSLRKIIGASHDRAIAMREMERLNMNMDSIEGENHEYAVIEVPEVTP